MCTRHPIKQLNVEIQLYIMKYIKPYAEELNYEILNNQNEKN